MESLFEKLFDTYGDTVLREQGVFDEAAVLAALGKLPLDQGVQLKVCDLLSSYYLRWSTAAFSTGLCLGLSLPQAVHQPRETEGLRCRSTPGR